MPAALGDLVEDVVVRRSGPVRPGTDTASPGVRDTTGAGDAVTGGYLAAVLAGAGPVRACAAGRAGAARVLGPPVARG